MNGRKVYIIYFIFNTINAFILHFRITINIFFKILIKLINCYPQIMHAVKRLKIYYNVTLMYYYIKRLFFTFSYGILIINKILLKLITAFFLK